MTWFLICCAELVSAGHGIHTCLRRFIAYTSMAAYTACVTMSHMISGLRMLKNTGKSAHMQTCTHVYICDIHGGTSKFPGFAAYFQTSGDSKLISGAAYLK